MIEEVWYTSEEDDDIFDEYTEEDDDLEETLKGNAHLNEVAADSQQGEVNVNTFVAPLDDSEMVLRQRNRSEFENDSSDEFEEEVNSATFIMNQKSLVDKAPGALQHSFAHRTIPLQNSLHIRLFQFISVCVICSMTAGIPFGLPALRQLLIDAGIYGGNCLGHNLISGSVVDDPRSILIGSKPATSKRVGCSLQEGRLAIFQVSGWLSWMIGGWIAARSVQHLGPRHTAMIGSILIMIGSLILAVSMPVNGDFLIPSWLRMYILPVMIMSIGSSFSFLGCLHYVRLFPKRTSLLHSLIFLAQDLSALIFYLMYEAREFISLRSLLFIYSGLMIGHLIFWKFVFSSAKLPTIRFTVTTWHQRPLLVDKSLPEHIASPYFHLALLFTTIVFLKIYFYMSTFQVQLRILLIPTKREVNPEDFTYQHIARFDEKGSLAPVGRLNAQNVVTQFASISPRYDDLQYFSHVPFFAEQPGGTSSNNLSLRQFTYNPMQPEIFLTDLQEMMYLLVPLASLITIFWMRSSMSDRKISTALLFSLLALVLWGFVQ